MGGYEKPWTSVELGPGQKELLFLLGDTRLVSEKDETSVSAVDPYSKLESDLAIPMAHELISGCLGDHQYEPPLCQQWHHVSDDWVVQRVGKPTISSLA